MQKRTYRLTVRLCSPLHINGGTDADNTRIPVMLDGKPYIPATAMKGLIREKFSACLKLLGGVECVGRESAETPCGCPCCVLFGKAGFQPSRVFFDHLTVPDALEPVLSLRTYVAIDRRLRTGLEGMLAGTRVVEPLAKNGQPLEFSGDMTVWYAGDAAQIARTDALLQTAVRNVIEIGSGKSRGYGLVETEVTAL